MIGRNRVVITGVGVLAANGIGKDAFWNSLLAGESGIGPITLFDASSLPCGFAGEVTDFRPEDYIDKSFRPKRMARFTQLALAATKLAIEDADAFPYLKSSVVPLYLGVSTSATDIIETQVLRIDKKGPQAASPLTAIVSLPQAGVGSIAAMLGIQTRTLTVSTGCPAGLDAIGQAFSSIRSGQSDIAIAGGTDAPITMLTMATFNASHMVPQTSFPPESATRPFDNMRDGGSLAEGACVLIMESLDHATERGATIYAEITGYSTASDIYDKSIETGLILSMQHAINNAGLMPSQIDHISAHGTGDVQMDQVETAAIKSVLGSHAYNIPVTSIKGVTGSPLAAAGPMQTMASALALCRGVIPPTTNHETSDPACDLDYVPTQPRKVELEHVLINNHGLGGCNSSLVLKKI